jgi:hypothetical protein
MITHISPQRRARPPTELAEKVKLDFSQHSGGYETNHLQIVVKGSQIAVFVNGKAGGFATDPLDGGRIAFSVCNFADTSLEARWDNLKIWDITDL